MPTALLLRFCLCSLLVFTLVFDTSAQRTSRKRSPAVTTTRVEEKSSDQLELCITQTSEYVVIGGLVKKVSKIDSIVPKSFPSLTDVSIAEKNAETVDCKETNGINKDNVADAYPYLTEDGLRLYFTSNREGGHGRFFISTRKSIYDPFIEPKILSKKLTDGYYAGTLTADELTLCMVKSGAMYISIRHNKNEEFPLPVKLEGASTNYHFGPSISRDGTEIFVTVTIGTKDVTRIYKRTAAYTVKEKGKLDVPAGHEASPGQLSKDGLSYYLSIESKDNEHLWKYTRPSTADNFASPVELTEPIKGLKQYMQPTLNGDGTIMVFVTSPGNMWNGDDIVLVNTFKTNLVYPKLADSIISNAGNTAKMINKISSPELIEYATTLKEELNSPKQSTTKVKYPGNGSALCHLKVYPNPFATGVIIEISEVPGHGALFNLYDLSGKIIKQEKISNLRTNLSVAHISAGVYTYQVIDGNGQLISSGKLVKAQ
jgi:hypothetical protein